MKNETLNMEITIHGVYYTRKSGYNYEIKGNVNGKDVTAYTNDGEAFDHIKYDAEWGTEEEKECYLNAVAHCNYKLEEAYNNL